MDIRGSVSRMESLRGIFIFSHEYIDVPWLIGLGTRLQCIIGRVNSSNYPWSMECPMYRVPHSHLLVSDTWKCIVGIAMQR